jgi:protein O-GlcNAc transferase
MSTLEEAINYIWRLNQEGNYKSSTIEAARLASKHPKNVQVQYLMAQALATAFAREDAKTLLLRCIELEPLGAAYHASYAILTMHDTNPEEVLARSDFALSLSPDDPSILASCSVIERAVGTIDRLLKITERAFSLYPDNEDFIEGHYFALSLVDRVRAKSFLDSQIKLHPSSKYLLSCRCANSLYVDEVTEEEIFAYAKSYGAALPSEEVSNFDFINSLDPEKRLRVGIFSSELRRHSVMNFLLPISQYLEKSEFELYWYPTYWTDDAFKILRRGHRFTHFQEKSSDQWRKDIVNDQIDILIDTSGITATGRCDVLSLKPAPVQVTMIGYTQTIGLHAIDYKIGDEYVDLPDQEHFFAERIKRIASPFICYQGNMKYPDLKIRTQGSQITFFSPNSFQKITPRMLSVWKRILMAVPHSRLILKANTLGNSCLAEFTLNQIAELGISDRIDYMEAKAEQADHLEIYQNVDITLDTYPYNGTTTTMESLLMGIPVITLRGLPHRTRVSSMILNAIGKQGWIANTEDEYIQKAIDLAKNIDEVRNQKKLLRLNVEQSPMMDGKDYGIRLGNALREIWRDYCSAQSAQ